MNCKTSLFIHVAWFKTREIRIRRMNVVLVCSILLLRSNLHYKQITEENVKWLASWEYFITSDHEIIALMFLTIHEHKYTYTYLSWKGLKHNIIFPLIPFSLASKGNTSSIITVTNRTWSIDVSSVSYTHLRAHET